MTAAVGGIYAGQDLCDGWVNSLEPTLLITHDIYIIVCFKNNSFFRLPGFWKYVINQQSPHQSCFIYYINGKSRVAGVQLENHVVSGIVCGILSKLLSYAEYPLKWYQSPPARKIILYTPVRMPGDARLMVFKKKKDKRRQPWVWRTIEGALNNNSAWRYIYVKVDIILYQQPQVYTLTEYHSCHMLSPSIRTNILDEET